MFVALRGRDEVLVRVDGEHLQRESRVSEPRVGYPFGEMYCMSCIAGGLGQGRGKRETNASIAVSTEGRPETGPSPNRTGQDRQETHFDSSYFTLVASQAALCVAPAHRHDRQGGKGQGGTQASSRWLRADMLGAYEVYTRCWFFHRAGTR